MLNLAFISEIGRTVEGNYLYKFDFTEQPETVWGDYFNVTPTIIVPNLMPYEENICESWRIEMNYHLILASQSGCFSMQDSFDKIIPLAFVDIEEYDLIYYNDKVLMFEFGESENEILEKIKYFNFKIIEKEELHKEEKIEEELRNNLVLENKEDDFIFNNTEKIEPLILSVGQVISHTDLKKILFEHGYIKVQNVYNSGEYAIRGSIVDIFSYDSYVPYKIDFSNNTIEKIYSFDKEEYTPISYFNKIEISLNKNEW